ncbi:Periplasmic binding protein [Synechococcus sp. PCC 7335]|uniref:iron-siderophore ABC transporter substrate-binding protein n=1 Tax=Synechococcus sp. (strain ATCC 29403 / PCC 7335) TaxID=91464 RepID=UPI00017EE7B4|nr:iron-siderophore ABC transporter substrate-binding protein [Synechococcus sp. PCC 7335]EDX85468.1 Periplasmic binding protein [Synechococcus sp. PCC 7335]
MVSFRFRLSRTILFFLVGLLWAYLLIACQPENNLKVAQSVTACYPVEHVAGETCMPERVERLATLDAVSLENAIALGIQPVASTDIQWIGNDYPLEKLEDIVDLGESKRPSLERMLPLKPDLILGSDFPVSLYRQTSQIAPTVFFEFEHSGLWKDVFQKYAETLNREESAQQVMDNYYLRLENFKQQFEAKYGADKLSSFTVSVVRVYPDSVYQYFRESFIGTILQDAGVARPEGQDISADQALQRFQNQIQAPISFEALDQIDGDVIFVWTAEDDATAQEAQQKLEELQANPLWQQLKAVQNNQVYVVPRYWIGSGPIAADAVIDDLFKYLIEKN